MPKITGRRLIFAAVLLLIIGVIASLGLRSVLVKKDSAQSSKLATENLDDVKCKAGLLAPTVDGRACSFKDIAAAEIERRNLCNKNDAREALDISCQDGFEVPEDLKKQANLETTPTSTEIPSVPGYNDDKPGSSSASTTNCTVKVLASNERFQKNKTLACGQFSEVAADEFFKDPRSGCISKEEALQIVKRVCAGETGQNEATSSAVAAGQLSNLVNCQSIAASLVDIVKKQPNLCSGAGNIPAEYKSCEKEIVAAATPVCLGAGGPNQTNLSGQSTGGQGAGGNQGSGCTAARDATQADPRACQFKDLAAEQIASKNLCSKEAAKTALDQVCAGGSSATSGAVTCGGAVVAANSEFQSQKELACGVGKSVAVKRIMERANSPCKTEADAQKALEEACSGNYTTPSTQPSQTTGSTKNCLQVAQDMGEILSNNRGLCASAQTVPAEYKACEGEILSKVRTVCSSTSGTTPGGTAQSCSGSLIVQDSQFQTSKQIICTTPQGRQAALSTIKQKAASICKTDQEVSNALDAACAQSGFGSSPNSSPAPGGSGGPITSNECQAFADSLYNTVNSNRSLCNSPIPSQYASCTNIILTRLAPICGNSSQPSPTAKCDGSTISKDTQFIQSRDLACGAGRSVAIQTITQRTNSPCKTEADAAKALDEACKLTSGTTTPPPPPPSGNPPPPSGSQPPPPPPASTPRCNCGSIAANPEFQQSKTAACANRGIAAPQIASKSNGACSESEARTELDKICDNRCTTPATQTPTPTPVATTTPRPTSAVTPPPPPNPTSTAAPRCSCSAVAANPEFQQNKNLACANRGIAAGQIASKSNGGCTESEARTALDQICDNQCTAGSGQTPPPPPTGGPGTPFYSIGLQPNQTLGGQGGTENKCTCQNIAANPEFQQNSGLACQYKSTAVEKIVAGSNGNCNSGQASAELDKICSNQCVDAAGNTIAPSASGGGFLGAISTVIKDIPVIGDLFGGILGGDDGGGGGGSPFDFFGDLFGGITGGGDDDGGGFDIGGIIGGVVDTIGGFFGGLF